MLTTQFSLLPDGRRVRVARSGQGAPLVFLHGYPDNLQLWARLAPNLSDAYETFAFDWPGMGYSDRPRGSATPFDMADRLRGLLASWSIERATIIGTDMGGQAALAFALKYPQQTERLVVMNCLAFPDEQTSWQIAVLRRTGLNSIVLRRLPALVFNMAEKSSLPRGSRLPATIRADMLTAFRHDAVRDFVSAMCADYERALPYLAARYSSINRPTLTLWGEHDQHFGVSQARRLVRTIPTAQLQIILQGQHWMVWHRAAEIAGLLRDFINQ